jgi:hypothetical protein
MCKIAGWLVLCLGVAMPLSSLAQPPALYQPPIRAVPIAPAKPAERVAPVAPSLPHAAELLDIPKLELMAMTTSLPWGAIGFLDNGCTAALIGPRHILAAAHCFTFDDDGSTAAGMAYSQGAWQRGLVFFPNYHPSRPNPPRVAVERAIVGSRVQDGSNTPADWGIGYLAEPVTAFPALSIQPMERSQYPAIVQYAGYARYPGRFPQKQASFPEPAHPNPSGGGYCANFKANCWWIPALVNPRCRAIEEIRGIVRTDGLRCPVEGGNSGSPVVWNAGNAANPAWRVTGVISGPGGFWDAARFAHAPRFARDIALATADGSKARTQVFAVDDDLSRVVSRTRDGAAATDPFGYFRDLGRVARADRIAATEQADGRPLLVASAFGGVLWVNHVGSGGAWAGWARLPVPPGVTSIHDIAAVTMSDGSPGLFVAGGGTLYYTPLSVTASGVRPESWTVMMPGDAVRRVSAIRHPDGAVQVLALAANGTLRSMEQTNPGAYAGWTSPQTFSAAPLSGLLDVTLGWTPEGRVQAFALGASGRFWARDVDAARNWGAWLEFTVPRFAPLAFGSPPLDGVISITAGRWKEGGANGQPVLFALDDQGNIYLSTWETSRWRSWRSFYN